MSKEKKTNNFFLKSYVKSNKDKDLKNQEKNQDKKEPAKPIKKVAFQKLEIKDRVTPQEQFPKKKVAGAYLIIIGAEKAAKVILHFTEEELLEISTEIIEIDKISDELFMEAQKKFGENSSKELKEYKGGKKYLRTILQSAYGLDEGSKFFIKAIEYYNNKEKSLSFMDKLPPKSIYEIIKKESDIINSMVLSVIDSQKSAEVLKQMPKEQAIRIIKKISNKIKIDPEIFKTVIKKLKSKAALYDQELTNMKGKNKLIEILKSAPYYDSSQILENLEVLDPELAQEIKENIFTFDDIINIPEKSLATALKHCNNNDIAYILKGADEKIKNMFFRNITKKRKTIIAEEIAFLGEVKKKDVDVKRKEFVELLKNLEEEEHIILSPDNEIYVE